MRGQSIFALIFFIIFAKVVLDRWHGANELLKTGGSSGVNIIKALS